MQIIHPQKGMTLIETLVVVSIFSSFIIFAITFLLFTFNAEKKTFGSKEMSWQAYAILEEIEDYLAEAEDIQSPSEGNTDNELVFESGGQTITFFEDQNHMFVQEDTNMPKQLTSDLVRIESVSFTNLSFSEMSVFRVTLSLYAEGTDTHTQKFSTTMTIR